MSKSNQRRSVEQRVANTGRERNLLRGDALTAYAMDRFLFRLARSSESKSFLLKGGVLVANLLGTPNRFTRDIDLLRRRGPCDPDDIRARLQRVVDVQADDPLVFGTVRAVPATHDEDGYDGVRVRVSATLGARQVDVQVDIGFGDAVRPRAVRRTLAPFLDSDVPATLLSYPAEAVVAEKAQTLLAKVPLIEHRMKDLLDVVVLADLRAFRGATLGRAMRATAARRGTVRTALALEAFQQQVVGRRFESAWAQMGRQKAVRDLPSLPTTVQKFLLFAHTPWTQDEPLLATARWQAGGPWEGIAG